MSSRAFSPNQPYNGLPLLPPVFRVETEATLKSVIRTRSALSGLNADARLLPNLGMLVRAIAIQEAKLSSEIENIVTTNDELYRAMTFDDESVDAATKEVLRYSEAVWAGVARLKQGRTIDPELCIELAGVVKGEPITIRSGSGTRVGNPRTGQVIYTPPEGAELLGKLVENVCSYLAEEDEVDPLIKLAVAHYQFEAIHPFQDGNGRTGRIVNVLYLIDRGLLDGPILYLSGALIRQRSAYYRGLREVTEKGAWEAWILFMLDATEQAARESRTRISGIIEAMDEVRALLQRQAPALARRELVDLIFSQPYTRISALEAAGIAKRQTASVYLQRLEDQGVLSSKRIWRDTIYVNDRLMRLLTL